MTCRYCRAQIRQYESYMPFLMPKPNGEVRRVVMHGPCIEKWNRHAVTPAFSLQFFRKASA